MTDLARRGPLGPKQPKPKTKRKGLPPISRKRAAYLASDARKAGLAHMAMVARLPCIVCGAHGVEVHHMPPRDDLRTAPLCARHHRREFGAGAYHYSPRAFHAAHGSADEILARVSEMLARGEYV